MKRRSVIAVCVLFAFSLLFSFASCGREKPAPVVLIPSEPVSQARALFLLQSAGWITLRDGADISATPADIVQNPHGFEIRPTAADQMPKVLKTAAFFIPETSVAYEEGMTAQTPIAKEKNGRMFPVPVVVRKADADSAMFRALAAALQSMTVADHIKYTYGDLLESAVAEPGSGIDSAVDYTELINLRLVAAAVSKPQAEILSVAAQVLKEQNITLDIVELNDPERAYRALENERVDAVFMQDTPSLDAYNLANDTAFYPLASVYSASLCIYSCLDEAQINELFQ